MFFGLGWHWTMATRDFYAIVKCCREFMSIMSSERAAKFCVTYSVPVAHRKGNYMYDNGSLRSRNMPSVMISSKSWDIETDCNSL